MLLALPTAVDRVLLCVVLMANWRAQGARRAPAMDVEAMSTNMRMYVEGLCNNPMCFSEEEGKGWSMGLSHRSSEWRTLQFFVAELGLGLARIVTDFSSLNALRILRSPIIAARACHLEGIAMQPDRNSKEATGRVQMVEQWASGTA